MEVDPEYLTTEMKYLYSQVFGKMLVKAESLTYNKDVYRWQKYGIYRYEK